MDFWSQLGNIILWSLWFTLFIAYLWALFAIITDIFRDHELSGWGKAGWTLFLIVVPWLGALVYLIARGRGHAVVHETAWGTSLIPASLELASAERARTTRSAKSATDHGCTSPGSIGAAQLYARNVGAKNSFDASAWTPSARRSGGVAAVW